MKYLLRYRLPNVVQEEEEDCQIVGIADAEDVTVDELWQADVHFEFY